jgi:tripartite-type tricarboxylate transporter receptor subunit TctC
MKLPRRQFLHLAAGAAALPAMSRTAWAQTYPTRPVRVIVSFAAAGPNDIVARLFGQWLSERMGQQVIVENRAGAGGTIGTEAVVNSPADGYTLLLVSSANAIHATLYERLNYDFIRDIQPIVHLASAPLVMVVHPSVPAKSVPEFIAYAKANPGKIDMASAGTGSTGHVTGELFKMMAKIDMVHVPYRGAGPAMTDLLGGQVQVLFDNVPSAIQYIRAGSLRALAVTTAMRSEALPDVPVVADFVPGYEVNVWYGIGAPKNTAPQIVDMLNREINAILADAKTKTRLADIGVTGTGGSSETFRKIIAEETVKWGKVVRTANIKPE